VPATFRAAVSLIALIGFFVFAVALSAAVFLLAEIPNTPDLNGFSRLDA
jgi:hypothetical protein